MNLASGILDASMASLRRHPVDAVAALALCAAIIMIAVNALYLQPGPHPAPFFSIRGKTTEQASPVSVLPKPRPPEAGGAKPASTQRSRADIVADLQRELLRRGFHDGPVDGVHGPKTDSAIRDFEQQAGLKPSGEPSEDLLRAVTQSSARINAPAASSTQANRSDPLGDLIAPPSKRVVAVQRALSDFGYAQLKPTGTIGPDTKSAIEKFERERRLPLTGTISDRLLRELAAMTGRPLE